MPNESAKPNYLILVTTGLTSVRIEEASRRWTHMSKITAGQLAVIADIIKQCKPASPTVEERDHMTAAHYDVLLGRQTQHADMMEAFIKGLREANPLFKEDVFRKACGYADPS
jgi:hypothetical protein